MRYMILLSAGLFSFTLSAAEVTGLNTFQAGEKALASEVNDNFTAVSDAVADNDARITANATAIQTNSSAVANRMTKNIGTCDPGTAIREIKTDGAVTCEAIVGGGDITAVTAGIGLTGGGDVGDVTLDIDTTQVQKRVTGTCSAGKAISSIDSNGSVTCISTVPSSGYVKLPAGSSTYKEYLISKPLDYTDAATVTPIFGGCNGKTVRLSYSSIGYVIGENFFQIVPSPTLVSLAIPTSNFGFYIASHDFTQALSDLQFITIGRIGGDAADTCTGDLIFYGIRIDYPSDTAATGKNRLFIPAVAGSN